MPYVDYSREHQAFFEVDELGLIEALVANLAVEALDEANLHRFAWRGIVPFNASLLLPGQHRV